MAIWLAVIVCVVIGLPTLFWSSYKVKEVVKPPKHQVKIPMKKQFAAFFQNKYAIIIALSFFMTGFCAYGKMTVMVFYFTYVCNNAALVSIAATLGLATAIVGSGFVGSWVFSWLKNKGKCLIFCYGLSGLFAAIGYFLTPGGTLWFITFAISQVMHCAGIGHAYGIVGDTVDVGEYKSGVRVDGFISSFVSLMMKAGGCSRPRGPHRVDGALRAMCRMLRDGHRPERHEHLA